MGAFKLGKMTASALFKKPETVMYPAVVPEYPDGFKGTIEVDADQCILCGMCERNCPTNAIEVDRENRTWSIKRYQCIQCYYCTRQCPKNCLEMTKVRPSIMTEKKPYVVQIPEPKVDPKKVAAAKAAAAAKAKKATE